MGAMNEAQGSGGDRRKSTERGTRQPGRVRFTIRTSAQASE